jgi:hypothetical protein
MAETLNETAETGLGVPQGGPTNPENAPNGPENDPLATPGADDERSSQRRQTASASALRGADGRYLAGQYASERPLTTLDAHRERFHEHLGASATATETVLADVTANLCAQADQCAAVIARAGSVSRAGRVRSVQNTYLKLVAQIERNMRVLGMKQRKSAASIADYLKNRQKPAV